MKHGDATPTPLKLVISGPVGVGKTTLVRTLCGNKAVTSDELTAEPIGKTHTTVALDFGQITLQGHLLHLFATPGQSRFDFMWEILSEGAFGLLLLVAADKSADFPYARGILQTIMRRRRIPFVIAVTRQDRQDGKGAWSQEKIAGYFGVPAARVVGIDARNQSSSLKAIAGLLALIRGSVS